MKHLIFLSLFAFIAIPSISQAYFTTAQDSFTVDNKTAVFTIDFKFGHKDHEVYIPILAKTTGAKSTDTLSYEILDTNDALAKGSATGLVLSNAAVKNGMYVIPKGKVASFTLLAFYTPEEHAAKAKYRAHVTNLPFSFDGKLKLQLNPSELQYYTTPAVTLHSPLFVFPSSATFTITK